MLHYELIARLSAFFLVLGCMAAWERLAPRRALVLPRYPRWASNLAVVLVDVVAVRLLVPLSAVGAAVLAGDRGIGLLNTLATPAWLKVLAAVVALDFVIYLQHVAFHAVPFLWRLHMVHHADRDIDVTTGLRFHPVEILLSMGIKIGAVFALGAPPAGVLAFEIILNATAMFNHSNVRLPAALDGVLRLFVVTPDMHRMHHSEIPAETNSCFGFNLPVWDRLCGTYRAHPERGHVGMAIGLEQFRTPRVGRLDWILGAPFARRPAATPAAAGGRLDLRRLVFAAAAILVLAPTFPPGLALVSGVVFSLLLGNPAPALTRKAATRLLQLSIIGLGAAMDLTVVWQLGVSGAAYTAAGIVLTLVVGRLLRSALGTSPDTSILLGAGTAICGGSAIAAVASTIRARDTDISVALATVFCLNAVALLTFPWLGHELGLTQEQFGRWCALAIHDTSSVVGAGLEFGARALDVGTTTKLARALWIVPLTLAVAWARTRKHREGPADRATETKFPWFIGGFVATAALVTAMPMLQPAGSIVATVSKRCLVLALFLIGSGLTRTTLASVGVRPFVHGLALWAVVAGATLAAVLAGWIM